MASVTVNLFDISWGEDFQSLSETIDEFAGLSLEDRWRGEIRLDDIHRETVDGARGIFLDFAKKREIGPGKLTAHTAIAGIPMRGDEDFGEETAALYVPSKKWLLVLRSQAGVGPNAMMGYFNALDPGVADRHFDYNASPKLDANVLRQLRRMRHITSVQVTATLDALNAAERDAGTSFARAARPAGAQRISFSLMANETRRKGHFLETGLVKDLLGRLKAEDHGVTSLKISGEDPDQDKDVLVDLIKHRLKLRYPVEELDVRDKRYTVQSRWRILGRAFRTWNNRL